MLNEVEISSIHRNHISCTLASLIQRVSPKVVEAVVALNAALTALITRLKYKFHYSPYANQNHYLIYSKKFTAIIEKCSRWFTRAVKNHPEMIRTRNSCKTMNREEMCTTYGCPSGYTPPPSAYSQSDAPAYTPPSSAYPDAPAYTEKGIHASAPTEKKDLTDTPAPASTEKKGNHGHALTPTVANTETKNPVKSQNGNPSAKRPLVDGTAPDANDLFDAIYEIQTNSRETSGKSLAAKDVCTDANRSRSKPTNPFRNNQGISPSLI